MSFDRLLIVDDDHAFRGVLARSMEGRGFSVVPAPNGSAALAWLAENECDLMVLDLRLPDMSGMTVLAQVRAKHPEIEVVVLTGHGTIDTAVEAIRMGAFHYLTKPCSPDELDIILQKARERRSLVERTSLLQDALSPPDLGSSFIGASPKFKEVVRLIDRVGPTDAAVLITGETGVGKELVAKLIHNRSARRASPFVIVDCGTLHEELLQNELFGHDEGAYTGARRQKHGLFEAADRGTIFLDEIGEISPAVQVQLLRVLESNAFRRLGGTRQIQVDVRLVAATNRDLRALAAAGCFREDLLYRLNTIRIDVPPLRERPEDIVQLVDHHLARFNARFARAKRFTPEAMALLAGYAWPGNVRQLIHVIEQAVVLSETDAIGPEGLPPEIRGAQRVALPRKPFEHDRDVVPLAEVERQYIEFVVRQLEGHRARAAQALGISERSLYRRLKELEIP